MSWNLENLKSQFNQVLASKADTEKSENEQTPTLKERSRSFFQTASEKLGNCRKAAGEKANSVAEQVASTITDWTGRETTSKDVKKVAKTGAIIGATMGVAMAAGPMVGRAMRQGVRSSAAARYGNQPMTNGGEPMPNVEYDPSQEWEQDNLDYDQQQYDLLQDHNEYMSGMDNVVEDQISYNESFDMGGFDY